MTPRFCDQPKRWLWRGVHEQTSGITGPVADMCQLDGPSQLDNGDNRRPSAMDSRLTQLQYLQLFQQFFQTFSPIIVYPC